MKSYTLVIDGKLHGFHGRLVDAKDAYLQYATNFIRSSDPGTAAPSYRITYEGKDGTSRLVDES